MGYFFEVMEFALQLVRPITLLQQFRFLTINVIKNKVFLFNFHLFSSLYLLYFSLASSSNGFRYRIPNPAFSIPLIFFTTPFSWPTLFSFLGSPIFTPYLLLMLTIGFLEIDKSLTLDLKVREWSLLVPFVFEPFILSLYVFVFAPYSFVVVILVDKTFLWAKLPHDM